MNRRTFLRKMFETALAITAGSFIWTVKKMRHGKDVRAATGWKPVVHAEKTANYPGTIKKPSNINTIGKWAG